MRLISCFITFTWISSVTRSGSSESASVNYGSPKFKATNNKKFNILAALFTSGGSHFKFFKPLLEELAYRGHNLTVLSYNPRKNNSTDEKILPNYKDVLLTDPKFVAKNVVNMKNLNPSYMHYLEEILLLRRMGHTYCEMTLNNSEVRQLINSDQKFDLIFVENFCTDCALGFVHKFQAPFIALSSHQIMPWSNDRLGNPDNPSYIPELFVSYSEKMNFVQRFINTFHLWCLKIFYEIGFQWYHQKLVDKAFGPGVPPLSEIAKKTSAFLANTHYSILGSRPYVPNVIEIGGMHISKPKPLPDDVQKFLDGATEGALLFSWGSMIKMSSVPQKVLDTILKVLTEMPRKVIWKWESKEFPKKLKNVMVKKWLPQFDIMSEYSGSSITINTLNTKRCKI